MRKTALAMLIMAMLVPAMKSQDTITEVTHMPKHISRHPQDPGRAQFVIQSKNKDFLLGIGGYAKLVAAFDFKGIIENYDFITYDIPVLDANPGEKRLYFDAHQSRLFTEVLGQIKGTPMRIYIETDFYSEHYYPRLRQAYGQIGGFLVGQTWSTLMDLDAMPNTIDFEGPNAAVALRVPMIRYEYKSERGFRLQMAAEMPEVSMSFYDNAGQDSYQYVPDMIINFKGGGKIAHVQAGGVFRTMFYTDSTANSQRAVYGYGAVLSAALHFTKRSHFFFQAVGGKGVAKYIQDISGVGYDAAPDENYHWGQAEFDMIALPCWGGYVAYQQYWHPRINSTFIYSHINVNNNSRDGAGYPYYKSGHYLAGNIFFEINRQFVVALEYLWGKRINEGGKEGFANRINAMAQFSF